jgi:N-acetylglucosamine-6-sulfatase
MSKIRCLILVLSMLLLLGQLACSTLNIPSVPYVTPNPSKPNIILFLTDDQPPQSLQYMPIVQKELIAKGINFTNGFVTTPLCCPSRASILTGLYAHNHGVLTDTPPQGGAPAFKDASTIAVWLKQAGYRTALMGKYLNDYELLTPTGYVPPGWDEWDAFWKHGGNNLGFYYGYSMSENGKLVQYSMDSKDYSGDILTAKALNFIQASGNRPFFLVLAYYNPHQTYQAADRFKNMFKTDATFTRYRPPNFLPTDFTNRPAWLITFNKPTAAYLDNIYQRILRSMMSVDEAVGQVTNLLNTLSERNRTAIFYLTDNGESLGDNGILGKDCPYDACSHVPFIVSYPPLTSKTRTDDHFVLNIDLAPTFASLGGATVPGKIDGVSLLPLLSDPNETWRDQFLIEHWQDISPNNPEGPTAQIPTFYALRTKDWKYVEYDNGDRELYDLKADPYELHNLAGQSAYTSIMLTLSAQLKTLKNQ